MKKIIMISVLSISISFGVYAQKLDASKVPSAVKASFAKQYPGVTAKWEKEDGKYEAGFTKNGASMSVLIDEKGMIAETEMDIKVADLPATAAAYVKEHYKGKTIKETAKITHANGTINYEVNVNGKDVIFDANGKFLEETKE